MLYQYTSQCFIAIVLWGYNAAFFFTFLFKFISMMGMGLLICKYDPLWQEVSVQFLILRRLLRPICLLSTLRLLFWPTAEYGTWHFFMVKNAIFFLTRYFVLFQKLGRPTVQCSITFILKTHQCYKQMKMVMCTAIND